jgi:excisionase family DNA binding protein
MSATATDEALASIGAKLDALLTARGPLLPRFLSLDAASQLYGISIDSLRRLQRDGRLRRYRPFPGKVLVGREELEAWLQASAE